MSAREGTPLPSGPVRFALEAGFIILAGVIAAVLDLSVLAIVVVMGLAWIVVALVERVAKSTQSWPRRPRERVTKPVVEPVREARPEPSTNSEPEPRRRRRFSEPLQTEAVPTSSREWNLWELERRARDYAAGDAVPEEWAAMFMHLREFANSDGQLPERFDTLVRESFPELTTV